MLRETICISLLVPAAAPFLLLLLFRLLIQLQTPSIVPSLFVSANILVNFVSFYFVFLLWPDRHEAEYFYQFEID